MPSNGLRSKSRIADTAWLAGIIDGEGCVLFRPVRKRGEHICRLTIGNTDEGIVNEVKRILDSWLVFYCCTAIQPRGISRKIGYVIEVNRQIEVCFVLEQVNPYLKSIKREKIKLVRDYMTERDALGRRKNGKKRNLQFGMVI